MAANVFDFAKKKKIYNSSSVVRHIPLDLIDPSLAIGFYCRDKRLWLNCGGEELQKTRAVKLGLEEQEQHTRAMTE
uniref:Uncharacterized protein n=1 Tax=Salix viminalis TaxID=40686 RepID=A0A6N2MZJ7_SALVM